MSASRDAAEYIAGSTLMGAFAGAVLVAPAGEASSCAGAAILSAIVGAGTACLGVSVGEFPRTPDPAASSRVTAPKYKLGS